MLVPMQQEPSLGYHIGLLEVGEQRQGQSTQGMPGLCGPLSSKEVNFKRNKATTVSAEEVCLCEPTLERGTEELLSLQRSNEA